MVYTEKQLELRDKFLSLRDNSEGFKDLCKNEILNLDKAILDAIIVDLMPEQSVLLLKMYREKRHISIREYYHFFRFDIWDYENSGGNIHSSKFQKKYKYPIRLFYILHNDLELSYREMEDISGIGKDTLNKYVRLYERKEELEQERRDLGRTILQRKLEIYEEIRDIEEKF